MKAFLWTCINMVKAGKCLVAWSSIQWSLALCGLGLLEHKLLGSALRMCWLWLQRMDLGHSWSTLPVRED
jgi:hypothetical protein